jgi:hypothetical protein
MQRRGREERGEEWQLDRQVRRVGKEYKGKEGM